MGESASVTWNMLENGIEAPYGFGWKGVVNTNNLLSLQTKIDTVIPNGISVLRYSPDGSYRFVWRQVSTSTEQSAYIVFGNTLLSIGDDIEPSFIVTDASFSPDNSCFAVACYNQDTNESYMRLYSIRKISGVILPNISLVSQQRISLQQSFGISFSPIGDLLVCTTYDQMVVWKVNTSLNPSDDGYLESQ